MVTRRGDVIVVSNDLTPGFGLPVAAPGLRAFGLAEGLRNHGFSVRTVVPRAIVDRQWAGNVPPAPPADTDVIDMSRLSDYLATRAPVTAIIINSNQADHLVKQEGVRIVLDFFAPKPYFLSWLLQTARDVRVTPLPVVNMCVPTARKTARDDGEVRLLVAGYAQSWNSIGRALPVLRAKLEEHAALRLDIVWRRHWGVSGVASTAGSEFAGLEEHPSVRVHDVMTFSEFRELLGRVDVAVDLFGRTFEREYAMVTRSAVALACGLPIVHPPFTEVSQFVRRFGAGWLVDADDHDAFGALIDQLVTDPSLLAEATAGAERAAAEVFDPAIAVRPLVGILAAWDEADAPGAPAA
ncbi:MAG: hypothetical protein LC779_16620 [Actinobacteria bacterium]|nr:hypothetical protein [Actinomycetota bacterium]